MQRCFILGTCLSVFAVLLSLMKDSVSTKRIMKDYESVRSTSEYKGDAHATTPKQDTAPTQHANFTSSASLSSMTISKGDVAYKRGNDNAPVVVKEFKLIFFTTPKVGCTVFKQLFRRMKGYENWHVHNPTILEDGTRSKLPNLPHDPRFNGLTYLSDYPLKEAAEMLTSPDWTRAIFIRDPKERFLSAYLDKVVHSKGGVVKRSCCPRAPPQRSCANKVQTFEGFANFIAKTHCKNHHWNPQWDRMEPKYWSTITFVGNFHNIANDTKTLLQHVGAWEFGANGWGTHKNESIFGSSRTKHATGSTSRLQEYYSTRETEQRVEDFNKMDYTNDIYSHLFVSSKTVHG